VFRTLWERNAALPKDAAERSRYLFAAVRNRALRERRHADVIRRTEAAHPPADVAGLGAPSPLPDTDIERQELHEHVRAAIDMLPEERRRVLLLRWSYQMPYDEI